MRRIVLASVSAPTLLLAGCVAPSQPPVRPAPPVAIPTPAPTPATTPPPASADWRDWPLTPGDWRYAPAAQGSSATYGPAGTGFVFRLHCDTASRRITLSHAAPTTGQGMTIRTTSIARTLPTTIVAQADAWPPQVRNAQLAASDALLDAIGYSRGRFLVEAAGASPLVLPTWSEIHRVIEDCRG